MKMSTPAKMGSALGAFCLIASLYNLAFGKAPVAQPKPDPCIQYLEQAREDKLMVEELTREHDEKHYNNTAGVTAYAAISAMNSSYYLACREREKNH